ncbi:uncharacterized protein LACBIDRAFT_293888 [Laccaria bicolor S238N-H82]|uniref:Predicted protein n=1 Tax=Laccaria bicolor (strain S238N-H82 / ATCC MYA-4686) TaxID=486041 RepID=B0D7G8_LACBS|nr:uncharacterized protein LACBIDRAFT_293888 [Laccaria bicolor S238N-H82]EDR09394.1 predicted protein [Laccaria bicolor S238N-H82]|eukprot:XP_001879743.1 predicted protein [Laccaria bicolor S238N-H82]
MATTNTASSPPNSTSKTSRFSTLKVFKFSSKEKNLKPPPLPPKDAYYLRNRSLASLSPDSLSLPPNSPLSPQPIYQYARKPSPEPHQTHPSQSTMSLVSSAASAKSSPSAERSRPQSQKKALSFLKFPKRSPKSPSVKSVGTSEQLEPPPSTDDEGISLPWNFQHNIHVDEGYVGLPPSWSTSLAEAGFSDEEIIAIQTRRAAGSRSPNLQYLYTDRPSSPVPYNPDVVNNISPVPIPVLTHPTPRSTSLPRQYSDASLQSSQHHRPSVPALPNLTSPSNASLQSGGIRSPPRRQVPSPDQASTHQSTSSVSYSTDSHQSSTSGVGSQGKAPLVPLRKGPPLDTSRRVYNVTNGTSSSPPPPSYINSATQFAGDNKDPSSFASSSTQRFYGSTQLEEASQLSMDTPQANDLRPLHHIRNQHHSLSHHKHPFDAFQVIQNPLRRFPLDYHCIKVQIQIPSVWYNLHNYGTIPTFKSRNPFSVLAARPTPSRSLLPESQSRRPPPSRPIPPITPSVAGPTQEGSSQFSGPERSNIPNHSPLSPQWGDSPSSNSPLWDELEGILSKPPGSGKEPYSAALSESFSPTLPFTPEEDRIATQRKIQSTLNRRDPNRDSSRSSSSTITVTGYIAPTIVRNVSIARRAGAYVIDKSKVGLGSRERAMERNGVASNGAQPVPMISSSGSQRPPPVFMETKHPPSPLSSHFGSEEESASGSGSSGSASQDHPTPTTEDTSSPLLYYLEGTPSPDPTRVSFTGTTNSYAGKQKDPTSPLADAFDEDDEDYDNVKSPSPPISRPTIVISDDPSPTKGPVTSITTSGTPLSPFQLYRGWLSEVVAPLEEYIDETVDPRDHYLDLKEIAEGESGSVFAARLSEKNAHKLRLPPLIKAKDSDDIANGRPVLLAIKSVAIVPSGSPKLLDLKKELVLMRGLWHENVLGMDALYVDLSEDSLWIRMELMERSLADIVGLVGDGLMLQDRMIARFASDLANFDGYDDIADFSNAVQVVGSPMRSDPAGVIFWQAPEMRKPPYNALKVDVWSLGATVWEMAETEPPFSETQQFTDRWPPLRQPELYSPAFHDFLRRCSEPVLSRPSPSDLMKTSFINNACGRQVIVQLLSQCMAIEELLQDGNDSSRPNLE